MHAALSPDRIDHSPSKRKSTGLGTIELLHPVSAKPKSFTSGIITTALVASPSHPHNTTDSGEISTELSIHTPRDPLFTEQTVINEAQTPKHGMRQLKRKLSEASRDSNDPKHTSRFRLTSAVGSKPPWQAPKLPAEDASVKEVLQPASNAEVKLIKDGRNAGASRARPRRNRFSLESIFTSLPKLANNDDYADDVIVNCLVRRAVAMAAANIGAVDSFSMISRRRSRESLAATTFVRNHMVLILAHDVSVRYWRLYVWTGGSDGICKYDSLSVIDSTATDFAVSKLVYEVMGKALTIKTVQCCQKENMIYCELYVVEYARCLASIQPLPTKLWDSAMLRRSIWQRLVAGDEASLMPDQGPPPSTIMKLLYNDYSRRMRLCQELAGDLKPLSGLARATIAASAEHMQKKLLAAAAIDCCAAGIHLLHEHHHAALDTAIQSSAFEQILREQTKLCQEVLAGQERLRAIARQGSIWRPLVSSLDKVKMGYCQKDNSGATVQSVATPRSDGNGDGAGDGGKSKTNPYSMCVALLVVMRMTKQKMEMLTHDVGSL